MPTPQPAASHDLWRQVVLQRPGGLRIVLTDLGATWMSCQVPLADGSRREVLLGYDRPEDYLAEPGYLGAIVGRYANRIAQARYLHQGAEVRLAANEGAHQLHGGPQGFDRRRWHMEAHGPHEAVMTLRSADGDQGFPGEVHALVHYALESPLGVTIRLQATATQTTPLALTSHAYFNLDAVHADCRTHGLRLHAGQYVPVDAQLIPQGTLDPVAGTDFDFRSWRRIGDLASGSEPPGRQGLYDHCFLLDERCRDGTLPAAELESPDGRLAARLYTDRPALQFYSGQWLATTQRRGGGAYAACQGLALEPGVPPDSPNRPHWQPWSDCFVEPGTPWRAWMRWEFQTR